jgi:signal transduction histidine kinase
VGPDTLASSFLRAPVALLVVRGRDLIVEHANAAALQILGKSQLAGESLVKAVPELEQQGCAKWLHTTICSGGNVGREAPVRLGSTEDGPLYWTILCKRFEDVGEWKGVLGLVDATAHAIARRELEQRVAEADAASRAKDEFVAMLSHELRDPIWAAVTALKLMRLRGLDTHEQGVIERQIGHLVRLVDDLLDASRIARGTLVLNKRPTQLATIVASALETVRPLMEQRKHCIRVDVPKTCKVNVDQDRIRQVVSNLLANAAKYSETSCEIVVEALHQDGKVLLSVTDRGKGIAPARLTRLFDGRRPVTDPQTGLGLGLVIARNLTRHHGGDLRAYSEGLGRGSRFVVELPAVGPGDVTDAPAAQPRG